MHFLRRRKDVFNGFGNRDLFRGGTFYLSEKIKLYIGRALYGGYGRI
jgi:hypothetical protein